MLLLISALGVLAAGSTARVDAVAISGNAVAGAVRVSGELSDETWRAAPVTDAFVQREPHEGAEPSQRTEFRVAYDATTLYVKVHAFDTQPDKIVSYLTRRDDDSP